ncbi:Cell morphogenesis protein PAG1 [Gaertneriomyces sp. JEL0708]|nr:Cell morphogenesis protein PAG1 [Gaertneriomyces sp. JEL0708]
MEDLGSPSGYNVPPFRLFPHQQQVLEGQAQLTPPLPPKDFDAHGPGSSRGKVADSATSASATPAHWILQNVFARFVGVAEGKVNSGIYAMPLEREIDLLAPLRPGADLHFDRLLAAMGSVAKHCPKLMIDSIMVWRKSKSEGEGRGLLTGTPHSMMKNKDLDNILKERKSLIANFILCRVLIAIIERLTRETLPDDLEEKLEDMVFGQLRNADPDLTSRSVNRQANIDLFAELAGALSNIRFASISARFVAELSRASAKQESKLELLIRSMRYLKLKIYPMDALEDSVEFLQTCAELFTNAHSTRLKHAYAEVFVGLMEGIAAVATAEVNLPTWMKTIEMIYFKANKMLGKPRHLQAAIPLINTLLCVSRKDFFLKHYPDFLELLFKQLRDKASLRIMSVTSITQLVWVYLFRCSESTAVSSKRIEGVIRTFFPTKGRGLIPPDVGLKSFVRVVYFICVRWPEWGVETVITGLLGTETAPQSSSSSGLSFAEKTMHSIGGSQSYEDRTVTSVAGTSGSGSAMGNSFIPIAGIDPILNPERLSVALSAFLLLLADMEDALLGASGSSSVSTGGLTAGTVSAVNSSTGSSKVVVEAKVHLRAPPFPMSERAVEGSSSYVGTEVLNQMRMRETKDSIEPKHAIARDIRAPLADGFILRMGASMRESLDRFNEALARVAIALDTACGWYLLTDTGIMLSTGVGLGSGTASVRRGSISDTATSNTSGASTIQSGDGRGGLGDFISKDRQVLFDLIHTYIDCLPRIAPTGLGPSKIIELLSRYVIHADEGIRNAAVDALKRICSLKKEAGNVEAWKFWTFGLNRSDLASEVVGMVAETGISILNDRCLDIFTNLSFDGTQGATWCVVKTYISLLEIWINDLRTTAFSSGDMRRTLMDPMEADWIVEEIESRGMLFLCSQIPGIRKEAIRILKLAEEFEQVLKGREDPMNHALDGVSKSDARRQTLRRQSKHDLRRQYTLQRSMFHPDLQARKSRVSKIMDECGADLIKRHYHDPVLAASTRSEHQKQQQAQYLGNSIRGTLVQLAGSDVLQDTAIWNRCWPDLCRWIVTYASPHALGLCMREVCGRLLSIQASVVASADQPVPPPKSGTGTTKWGNERAGSASASGKAISLLPLTEEMIEQWKVYLVFGCAGIEIAGSGLSTTSSGASESAGVSGSFLEKNKTDPIGVAETYGPTSMSHGLNKRQPIPSARQLFQMLLPLLSSERASIRQATVTGLSAIHWLSYQTFLEDIQPYMKSVVDDLRLKLAAPRVDKDGRKSSSSQASGYPTSQSKRYERVRMELTHVLSFVANFVDHRQYRRNESLMNGVTTYIKEMARFLSDPDVQLEWDHQMLRYYFSGFVERFYDHLSAVVNTTPDQTGEALALPSKAETESVEEYLPFDVRVSLFRLFEQWCGYGQFSSRTRDREAKMMLAVLDQVKDIRERGALTSTMEEQRKALETASLKAMAALCKGPVVNPRDTQAAGLELRSLITWIDAIFASPDDKFHVIARAALEALLSHNGKNSELLNDVIRQCYVGDVNSNVTQGYFMAVVDICVRDESYPCSPARMCALALFKAGDPNLHIRRGAVRLLRALEGRFWASSSKRSNYNVVRTMAKEFFGPPPQLSDLEAHMLDRGTEAQDGNDGWDDEAAIMAAMALIDEEHATYEAAAVTSSLPIVYKYAQAMVSGRLAAERREMTDEMLSEMIRMSEMVSVSTGGQKVGTHPGVQDILIFMLPWIRNVDLFPIVFDSDSESVGMPMSEDATVETSRVILNNLFYLTIKYGDDYVTEIENIWAQLVQPAVDEEGVEAADTNDHGDDEERWWRHVTAIITYLLSVGVNKRNPKFVTHARKVMVYIARTRACEIILQELVNKIAPKSLVPAGLDAGSPQQPPIPQLQQQMDMAARAGLYMADLSHVLVDMPKRPAFSKGQLACVLLVDLAVEVGTLLRPHLPLLLHVIFVQLDHFITLICEQNRLLLINLIQSIIPRDVAGAYIDTVHAALSLKEGKRLWAYEDISPNNRDIDSQHQLESLVLDVLELFSVVDSDLGQKWGEEALTWGTSCPVRHIACRSLQVYRVLRPGFNLAMVRGVVTRLGSTIADAIEEIQGFALENLAAMGTMVDVLGKDGWSDAESGSGLLMFPQFFWAAVACLYSPHEWEFLEGVLLLQKIINHLDLSDIRCRNVLLLSLPVKWRGGFTGLQPLLLRGLKSALSEKATLAVINGLTTIEDGSLIDISKGRAVFAALANLPRWINTFDKTNTPLSAIEVQEGIHAAEALALTFERDAARAPNSNSTSQSRVGRVLESYVRQRFRNATDFLKSFWDALRTEVSWECALVQETKAFLMGLLENDREWYRKQVLQIIRVVFPVLQPMEPTISAHGRDSQRSHSYLQLLPLLSLLHSPLAADALTALDAAYLDESFQGPVNLRTIFGGRSIHKIAKDGDSSLETNADAVRTEDFRAKAKMARYNMMGVAGTCDVEGRDKEFGSGIGKVFVGKGRFNDTLPASVSDHSGMTLKNAARRRSQASLASGFSLTSNDSQHQTDIWNMDDLDLNGGLLDTLTDLDVFFGRSGATEVGNEEESDDAFSGIEGYENEAGLVNTELDMNNNTFAPSSGLHSSPSQRLLSHPDTRAYVSFHLSTAYEKIAHDAEFVHWLRADLAKTLRADIAEIFVERVERVDAVSDGWSGTRVMVAVGNGVESAEYAEAIADMITSLRASPDTGSQQQFLRDMLNKGVVTHAIVPGKGVEIVIGFMGIWVPYIMEGRGQNFRERLLDEHADASAGAVIADTAGEEAAGQERGMHAYSPPLSPQQQPTSLFQILPASYELLVQFSEDFQSSLTAVPESPILGDLRLIMHGVGSWHPAIVDQDIPLQIAHVTDQWMDERSKRVERMNRVVAEWVGTRGRLSELTESQEFGGQNNHQSTLITMIDLAVGLVEMWGEVLGLVSFFQGTLNSSNSEEGRMVSELQAVEDRWRALIDIKKNL